MAETKSKLESEPAASSIAGEVGAILGQAARVETVFGAPVTQGELTVVPVARARWGFGGGRRGLGADVDGKPREGMGGGGGMRVEPVGIVVIRGDDAEFRPIKLEPRWGLLLGLAALGFVIGRL
jgi:uncharacterized spore protein YtfJ